VQVYGTDKNGSIIFTISPKGYKVEVSKED
jgi:beta-lactamase superfamily II metal-dependent hydrolase